MRHPRTFDVLVSITILVWSSSARAQMTIHVPADHPTIEAALAAAQSGDTVLVAPGDYSPPGAFVAYTFGGKNIHLLSSGGPAVTRLVSPNGLPGVVPLVSIVNGEGPGAILEGFTLDALNGSSSTSTTGIRIANSSPTVRNCVVRQCKGLRGGAMSIGQFGAPLIEGNVFENNYANDQGGAISIINASPVLHHNVLRNNGAFNGGGAISIWGALTGPTTGIPVLDGNTITANYCPTNHIGSRGGGIFVGFWNGTPASTTVSTIVRNCIVWGNTANVNPGIVFNSSGTFSLNYTDSQESWAGTGNLVTDPMFVNAGASDFHLLSNSPCIDTGDPASALDPDGTRADMGAYPFFQCPQPSIYCTTKTNSFGCVPAISFSGAPSTSSASPFLITASQVLNNKFGLLFYGFAASAAPFQGGYLCVAQPTTRTPVQSSNGNAPPDDCSGSYAIDFNARIQSGVDAQLVVGAAVFCEWWSRDPASASTTGLTNALQFLVCQ